MQKDQDMLEEYDFSKGVMGKYAEGNKRAKVKAVKNIDRQEYFKNVDTVDKLAGRLGCKLGSFDPGWRLHFHHYSCMDIPYEVMRELASLLGHKWVDKK